MLWVSYQKSEMIHLTGKDSDQEQFMYDLINITMIRGKKTVQMYDNGSFSIPLA